VLAAGAPSRDTAADAARGAGRMNQEFAAIDDQWLK
jgi:hypothetical protein